MIKFFIRVLDGTQTGTITTGQSRPGVSVMKGYLTFPRAYEQEPRH